MQEKVQGLPTWGLPVGEVQAKQQSTSAQNTSTADGTTSEKADPAELGMQSDTFNTCIQFGVERIPVV